jgi:hypothetical protein
MPDGETPEELTFSVARIEKPQRKPARREEFLTCPDAPR